MYHWPGNCWWWRFPCPCSHTHIYIFMYILILMSNNLVNQSTKAISTNELRWIGPVLAVVSSGPMDLFLLFVNQLRMLCFNIVRHFKALYKSIRILSQLHFIPLFDIIELITLIHATWSGIYIEKSTKRDTKGILRHLKKWNHFARFPGLKMWKV